MANSRFEYVRKYELDDSVLMNTWIVVRVDGRGFSRFVSEHHFEKPNDIRGIHAMNFAAAQVMKEFQADMTLAYGHSDEYSFVIHRSSSLFSRRSSKLVSTVVSCFASGFVFYWNRCFGADQPLLYPPVFDARVVCYPTDENLKDYLSWRQADCHINNLYNTCFWYLVQKGGRTNVEAEAELKTTVSADKNELLFSKFQVNYNNIEPIFRKGTILVGHAPDGEAKNSEHPVPVQARDSSNASEDSKSSLVHDVENEALNGFLADHKILKLHRDLISQDFWEQFGQTVLGKKVKVKAKNKSKLKKDIDPEPSQ
eukprot:TRINITY_DN52061_c0_g2_i1.p1 TRINITY_DN52061_c0_g2~~TRINITY_DN52061_c0_g2_i1.p1  ORF type:complete len:312 (+),score=91.74 TRINITY_DN52061_c0_g2_i1:30-965(+)